MTLRGSHPLKLECVAFYMQFLQQISVKIKAGYYAIGQKKEYNNQKQFVNLIYLDTYSN